MERKRRSRSTKRLTDVENEIMKELKKPRLGEPACAFFTSFEGYITGISENEKLELNVKILKSIFDIKAKLAETIIFNIKNCIKIIIIERFQNVMLL